MTTHTSTPSRDYAPGGTPHAARQLPRRLAICVLVFAATVALSTGCATVVVRQRDNRRHFPACYPATAGDLRCTAWAVTGAHFNADVLGSGSLWPLSPFFLVGAVVDLPLSLVVDTLALPADVAGMIEKRRRETTAATAKTIWAAMEVFRQEHARFPSVAEGLAILVPKYLAAVPPDAWGTPFRFGLADGRPRLQSADRDRRFDTYPDSFYWYPMAPGGQRHSARPPK